MNKGRIPFMIVIMVMVFLYISGIVELEDTVNYAFSLALLVFSIASVIDTYEKNNKWEERVRYILITIALGIAVILPYVSDATIVQKLMTYLDTNILLLLSVFFTLAGQWAAEIKLKDAIKNREK